MELNTHQLEAFNEVSRTQNFTKAAKALGLTQSALSQRVMNLEEQLGITLFIRERSGARLTAAGYQLLHYCQAKEALESDLLYKIRADNPNEFAGSIRIAGFSSIMSSVVLPLFSDLLKNHPKVHLHLFSRELDELPEMLKKGEVDFILMDQKLDKREWVSTVIGTEENVWVEKKGYRGPNVYLENDENELTTRQYFALPAHKKKESYSSFYVDDIYGIIAGLKAGIGRAIMPKHLIRQERHLQVLKPGAVLNVPVVLHYIEQTYYPRLHHEVVSILSSEFGPSIQGNL